MSQRRYRGNVSRHSKQLRRNVHGVFAVAREQCSGKVCECPKNVAHGVYCNRGCRAAWPKHHARHANHRKTHPTAFCLTFAECETTTVDRAGGYDCFSQYRSILPFAFRVSILFFNAQSLRNKRGILRVSWIYQLFDPKGLQIKTGTQSIVALPDSEAPSATVLLCAQLSQVHCASMQQTGTVHAMNVLQKMKPRWPRC